jgi:hypothetical protein
MRWIRLWKGQALEGGKCAASTVGGQNLRGAVVDRQPAGA